MGGREPTAGPAQLVLEQSGDFRVRRAQRPLRWLLLDHLLPARVLSRAAMFSRAKARRKVSSETEPDRLSSWNAASSLASPFADISSGRSLRVSCVCVHARSASARPGGV